MNIFYTTKANLRLDKSSFPKSIISWENYKQIKRIVEIICFLLAGVQDYGNSPGTKYNYIIHCTTTVSSPPLSAFQLLLRLSSSFFLLFSVNVCVANDGGGGA